MTNQMPTSEQIKKFWKRCGLYAKKHPQFDWFMWYSPDKKYIGNEVPELDLNNLFQWAVPKLSWWRLTKSEDLVGQICAVATLYGVNELDKPHKAGKGASYNTEPALALFWACYEALGLEK